MEEIKFCKELYSKIALLKAAYNFTDKAYIHLDADNTHYYVTLTAKQSENNVSEEEFLNEMLAQSVRHEVYKQTKNIRELLLARAMATSVVLEDNMIDEESEHNYSFSENDILKDWFADNEENKD